MNFAATVIWILHILLVAWVIITPFTENEPMLVLHLIMLPFLWVHWLLNDDTCALTLMEQHLRGIDPSECAEKSFFYNLVSPVYKIQDASIRELSWIVSIVLWLITLSKIVKKPEMMRHMYEQIKQLFFERRSTEAAS